MNVDEPSGGDVSWELEGGGRNVKVSPSVVTIVGLVRLGGTEIVSDPPIMMPPELEITVCPSGSVNVVGPSGGEVFWELKDDGRNVNVSPFQVVVMGVLIPVGTVRVEPSRISKPLEETTTRPSGSVKVRAGGGTDDELPIEVGKKVNVSEFQVVLSGAVSPVGTVKVLPSKMIKPPEEITTRPSGSVKVVGLCPLPVPEDELRPLDELLDSDAELEDEPWLLEGPPSDVVPFP